MLVEEHLNSNNEPFKFNGKELDEETGNYYYGARYYNPKWSIWLSVDPLAEERPGMSPYNYVQNNPLNRIDPTGALDESVQNADDIRFRDKEGNLIATYYTDKVDDDVYLPVSAEETNINLNEQLGKVDMEDVDAVGIGGNWDFTFVMGGGKSLEAVYFLDGKDKGSYEFFETTRQNVGINGGVGVYGIFADFQGKDSQLTMGDYKGKSFSISAGIRGPWIGSYSKFWAPDPQINDKSGFKSLFNKDLRLWSGYTVGGGAGAGLQWSKQKTSIYKK